MTAAYESFADDLKKAYRERNVLAVASLLSDYLLGFAVASLVGLMIIPLPTWLLDMLLTLNITIGVVMLITSMFITTGTQIASFPTILLLTTLFRLALDISATRLILIDADAGEVIRSFGEFVVGGDFIVGAVIFLIISLVQFIVIAKGAERVGEVAARFFLDAIPGRQMLIESDLKANAITNDQAREMRHQLNVEMQFYSRMEGSMRFIKGDAIAALVISAINLGAGLLIGVARQGLPLLEAAQTYAILTIGNGLVSQIPALLICISAGITISRVTREKAESSLGRDVAGQFLSQPKALLVSSMMLVAFFIVPGLPKLPFLLLGALLGGTALVLYRHTPKEKVISGPEATVRPPIVHPLVLQVSSRSYPEWNLENEDLRLLKKHFENLSERLYAETGVPFPTLELQVSDSFSPGQFSILIHSLPYLTAEIPQNMVLVASSHLRLSQAPFNVKQPRAAEEVSHLKPDHSWILEADGERLKEHFQALGIKVMQAHEVIFSYVEHLLRKYILHFIDIQEVKGLLDQLKEPFPTLIDEVEKKAPLQSLTQILRRLLEEGVSIRNLKTILEFLVREGLPATASIPERAESLRRALRDQICIDICGTQGICYFYSFGAVTADYLSGSMSSKNLSAPRLSLGISAYKQLRDAVQLALSSRQEGRPLIIADKSYRRQVWEKLSDSEMEIAVLCHEEISPLIEFRSLAEIEINFADQTTT